MNIEIDKFNNLAHEWWDQEGTFKTLHRINPTRMQFIKSQATLINQEVLDLGCGGGILCEALAQDGANVTGIDLAPKSIEVAKLHLFESKLMIKYDCIDSASHALNKLKYYDVITCMEMLEHVDDPEQIIEQCAKLIKPQGMAFFSTINQNLTSYVLGVLVAEYALRLLPRGTHDYKKFIKPTQLQQMLNKHGFDLVTIKGIAYNPITNESHLTNNVKVNYILSCIKR